MPACGSCAIIERIRRIYHYRRKFPPRGQGRVTASMIILGIDPGYAIVGWGVVEYISNRFAPIGYGAVITEKDTPFEQRLVEIYESVFDICKRYQPEALSIEKLYYQHNQTTVIGVAEARGVILLAAAQCGVPIYEYTPMQVKQAVVGYGLAEKKQVMDMVKRLLKLKAVPRPDDAADALAIAICHARSATSLLSRVGGNDVKQTI